MRQMFCFRCHSVERVRDRSGVWALALGIIAILCIFQCLALLIFPLPIMLPAILFEVLLLVLFRNYLRVCGKCGSTKIIPADSPRAREWLTKSGLSYEELWMGSAFAARKREEAEASPR